MSKILKKINSDNSANNGWSKAADDESKYLCLEYCNGKLNGVCFYNDLDDIPKTYKEYGSVVEQYKISYRNGQLFMVGKRLKYIGFRYLLCKCDVFRDWCNLHSRFVRIKQFDDVESLYDLCEKNGIERSLLEKYILVKNSAFKFFGNKRQKIYLDTRIECEIKYDGAEEEDSYICEHIQEFKIYDRA